MNERWNNDLFDDYYDELEWKDPPIQGPAEKLSWYMDDDEGDPPSSFFQKSWIEDDGRNLPIG
jgi:hypothetical protein